MTAPFHPAFASVTLGGPTCLELKHDACTIGLNAAREVDALKQGGRHGNNVLVYNSLLAHTLVVFWDADRDKFVRCEWDQKRMGDGTFGPKIPKYTPL